MHPADLRVCPVTDPESDRVFCDLPYQLYRADPCWVPPLLLSPYNPPRYERFVMAAGFAPRCDYHAYDWSADRPHAPSVDRLLRRLSAPGSGLVLRPSRPSRWDEEARVLFELYNAAFA